MRNEKVPWRGKNNLKICQFENLKIEKTREKKTQIHRKKY
jgi:hypothetical protein